MAQAARSTSALLTMLTITGAYASDAMEPVDVGAEMSTRDWWMADTDIVLLVRGIPADPDVPGRSWPTMLSDDYAGGTMTVHRTVVEVEESILGRVKKRRIELWRGGDHAIATPERAIVFAKLWNLEGGGFETTAVQRDVMFYASDALNCFSPWRVLPVQNEVVFSGGKAVCLDAKGWFRWCEEDMAPASVEEVVHRIRERTVADHGVTVEGFDP